jgi:hypothetical protein
VASERAQYTHRDWVAVVCVACIALGWFAMDTLQVSLGGMGVGTRFYELLAVQRHPSVLLFGSRDAYGAEIFWFALLCSGVLGAALAPQFAPALASRRRGTSAGILPLALMALMGAALYRGGLRLDAAAPPDSLRADLLRLAQDALQRAQGGLARHVTVGSGAYLSLLASLLLAVRSLARLRVPLANPAGELPSN